MAVEKFQREPTLERLDRLKKDNMMEARKNLE